MEILNNMQRSSLEKVALSLFILSVVITILILAKLVLIPLAISIFIAYLLYPLVWKIERWGVHRSLAILSVLLASIILFAGIVTLISVKLSNMTIDFGHIQEQVISRLDAITAALQEKTGLNSHTIDTHLKQGVSSALSSLENKAGRIFSSTTTVLFQIGVLPVFTFFLLYYRQKTANFIFRLAGPQHRAKALKVLREISSVATKYITGQFLVILILAVLNTIGLSIIGVPNAVVFGSLAAVLNLVPYLGMLTANAITMLYVVFTMADPFHTILYIFLMYMVIQFLENNLITPSIVGNNIKINPFAIIVSLLLANIIWGVAGMLIIIPSLAMMKIIMHNIDDLKPFAYLISDRGVPTVRINFSWFQNIISRFKNIKLPFKK